ncbi:MAG: hypothetical protein B6I31_02480 [Desulfobacteraceae bacterium 4572_19]|nr:MAG: hypothetical protein B6I31_02480 [Desulfobacteraceae bacterium 4572_19]
MAQKIYGRYEIGRKVFKDYILKSFIGKGVYGWVYLVENRARKRALKIFNEKINWENRDEKGENRGIKAVKDIASSHLVDIIDYGETFLGESCVLMEYIRDNLEKEIERRGKFKEEDACRYFLEILKGLRDLEKYGVIHRDIKPANLFLYGDTIKIGDYSFVRCTSGTGGSMSGVFGSPVYSAPEVFDEYYSHAADSWSAVVIFFQMLTGKLPFSGTTALSIMNAVTNKKPDYIAGLKETQKYYGFFEKCFKKNPENRFQNIDEIIWEFENITSFSFYHKREKQQVSAHEKINRWKETSEASSSVNSLYLNNASIKEQSRITINDLLQGTSVHCPITGMKFVYISSGSFIMGSSLKEAKRKRDEKQHCVILTKGFYMQVTAVTQAQWKKIMGTNPSYFTNNTDDCPVECVSWDDAQHFIQKLNQKNGSNKYSLPTEAQWEYAARAETQTPFYFGDYLLTTQANYDGNQPMPDSPKGIYRGETVRVTSFSPNKWGIFNMHGNVLEWCQDWKGEYPSGSIKDPVGPSSGSNRVIRGGSWGNYAQSCRSANRGRGLPGYRISGVGFRLVLSV